MGKNHKKLSNNLEKLRMSAGITQQELSESAGVSRVSINAIENGVYVPSTVLALKNAKTLNCRYVLFNEDISPSQFKNIQKILTEKLAIFDRTGIILEIFKKNAKTKESKYQVELASLQYMLPRLTRQWTHLERQMGGVGTRGGPGEKQIEIDRRLIGKRIYNLKTELETKCDEIT